MRKDPRVYLAQILERIERIVSYTEPGKESFLGNPIVQDAVIRNLEVMGEAAKRIPDDYKASLPIIPWRGLAGLRDVLTDLPHHFSCGWVIFSGMAPKKTRQARSFPAN